MRHRLARQIALLLAVFLLTGCSGASRDSQNNTTSETAGEDEIPTICAVLTDKELQDIFSGSFTTSPVAFLSEGADGCKYNEEDKQEGPARTLNFIVRKTDSAIQAENEFYRAVNVWQNSNLENRNYQYIENLGDKAFWAYSEKTPQLISYYNNFMLIVTSGNFGQDNGKALEMLKNVSSKLLERLE